jgi:hypothetical protein
VDKAYAWEISSEWRIHLNIFQTAMQCSKENSTTVSHPEFRIVVDCPSPLKCPCIAPSNRWRPEGGIPKRPLGGSKISP